MRGADDTAPDDDHPGPGGEVGGGTHRAASQAARAGASAPIVVSSPWPVSTRVASGSTSRRSRIESTIVG